MKIVGILKLDKLKAKHANVRKQIDAWIAEVTAANWKTPQNIKDRYRSADFLHDGKVVFDIKGNQYRIVISADFQRQIVFVEWVGTHAEYSKMKF